jgi:hypothetical protein
MATPTSNQTAPSLAKSASKTVTTCHSPRNVGEFPQPVNGGRITSDAGALLLGATDRVIGLTRRLAACFTDARNPDLIEHDVETLVMQRVVGIALGYEDLIDHDELRHDPVMAVLAGKLAARRSDCAPLAGKSTLNRLELSRPTTHALRQACREPRCDGGPVRRSVPRCAQEGAGADHARSRRHR